MSPRIGNGFASRIGDGRPRGVPKTARRWWNVVELRAVLEE